MKYFLVLFIGFFLCGCSVNRYYIPLPENIDEYKHYGEFRGIKQKYLTIWDNLLHEEYVIIPVRDGMVKVFIDEKYPPRVHFIEK